MAHPRRNFSAFSASDEGFTLIELSIVLVIIGLIIGGVLVGQDLVSAAATRAQITQIEKYNSAVNTFKTKYNGIPGDLNLADATNYGFNVPSTCTGQQGGRDGNGLIDGNIAPATLAGLMGESALFWEDLSTANLIDAYATANWTYSAWDLDVCLFSVSASQTEVGNYIPPGKIGYGTFVHVYATNGNNWYMLAQITSFGSGSAVNGIASIPVIQAAAIDKKIDDGLPAAGAVQAVYITSASRVITTPAPNAASDTAATCYHTNSPVGYSTGYNGGSSPNCALSFKMQGAAR